MTAIATARTPSTPVPVGFAVLLVGSEESVLASPVEVAPVEVSSSGSTVVVVAIGAAVAGVVDVVAAGETISACTQSTDM